MTQKITHLQFKGQFTFCVQKTIAHKYPFLFWQRHAKFSVRQVTEKKQTVKFRENFSAFSLNMHKSVEQFEKKKFANRRNDKQNDIPLCI